MTRASFHAAGKTPSENDRLKRVARLSAIPVAHKRSRSVVMPSHPGALNSSLAETAICHRLLMVMFEWRRSYVDSLASLWYPGDDHFLEAQSASGRRH